MLRSEEEFDPEFLHERDATHHHRFLELHVGDAVHQHAAGTVIAFEDSRACAATLIIEFDVQGVKVANALLDRS